MMGGIVRRTLPTILAALSLLGPPAVWAATERPPARSAIRCAACPRDAHGRIKRDTAAVTAFTRRTPRPPDCSHCEVDHIIPLHQGGADVPGNMQWLPREQHREKTRGEMAHGRGGGG